MDDCPPAAGFDLLSVDMPIPRDVDPVLATQGFKDLLDEIRAILERELTPSELEMTPLTGAICHDVAVYRPGIWLIVRETEPTGTNSVSLAAQVHLRKGAETVGTEPALS
jgi:hypothetical protein